MDSPCEDNQDTQPQPPVIHRCRQCSQNRNDDRRVFPNDDAGDHWPTLWEMAVDAEEPQQWLPVYNEETGFMRREHLLENHLSPITVLLLFLTTEFWNLVVIETNR